MSLALLSKPRGFALSAPGNRKLSIPRISLRNAFVPSDGRVGLFILTRASASRRPSRRGMCRMPGSADARFLLSALPLVLGLQVAAFVLVQHFRPPAAAGLDRILLHLYQLLFGVLVVLGAVVAGMEPQAAMGAAICGLVLAIRDADEGADGADDKEEAEDRDAVPPRTGLATRLVFTRAPSDTYASHEPAAEEV
ncbi:uncharacterized protein LOC62_03G004534 [Vanrija pseudolonga]|uniref:Uncharacterized protein n=1 Tax=Vanrija pseudolonga TaxID=143232 RepID=A0AAF0YAD8_9TREE|nr:hypothetical protein LOC62_03G004534 [Vanrija pseudolonga]